MEIPTEWEKKDNKIERIFVFDNFIKAIDFVNKIAKIAEELNHHPDIEIFSYKKVKITLTTHEIKNISQKDIEFATRINRITSSPQ